MLLIHSLSYDNSTNFVIDWLAFFRREFSRINVDQTNITLKDIDLVKDGVVSYWYRKGDLRLEAASTFIPGIKGHLDENNKNILEYFCYLLEQKKHINSYLNARLNKLVILEKAKEAGLLIPESKLRRDIQHDIPSSIYKPVTEGGTIGLENYVVLSVLTQAYKNEGVREFGPTLFQEKVDKKYELRIFYLNGRFRSMAIFSQKDVQTSLDFRNYNEERPNRTVPYKIPEDIEAKLDSLMKNIHLNCGSIDMIVSKDNNYYFLEINPVGQFGMVSFPCNYHIEKEIAEYLSHD